MAKALTLQEKRDRNMAAYEARITDKGTTTMEQTTTTQEPTKSGARRIRPLMTGLSSKMLPFDFKLPGYYIRVANDEGTRIKELMDAGYEFISEKEVNGSGDGDRVRYTVGSTDRGDPIYAYPMKQRLDWHEEDEELRRNSRAAFEDTLKNPTLNQSTEPNTFIHINKQSS